MDAAGSTASRGRGSAAALTAMRPRSDTPRLSASVRSANARYAASDPVRAADCRSAMAAGWLRWTSVAPGALLLFYHVA